MTKLPPECPIEVRFSLSKSLWFDMVFVTGRQGRVVETSDTMWDIGDLFQWLRGIVRGDGEVTMRIDSEGEVDDVRARYIDDKRLHLTIYKGFANDQHPYLDAVVSRRKLVWEIYYELRKLSLELGNDYRPEKRITDPDWTRLPEVEEWLDWEKYTNPYSMQDDVTNLERVRD